MIRTLAVLLSAATLGCALGPSLKKAPSARSPEGATVRIAARNIDVRRAELLEVRDSSVLVRLEDNRLAAIHYRGTRVIEAGALGSWIFQYSVPRPEQLDRLRAISRFPQGLTPALLAGLLRQSGQSEPEQYR